MDGIRWDGLDGIYGLLSSAPSCNILQPPPLLLTVTHILRNEPRSFRRGNLRHHESHPFPCLENLRQQSDGSGNELADTDGKKVTNERTPGNET